MKSKLVLFTALLLSVFWACNEIISDEDSKIGQSSTVTISLTDAPFPSDSVAAAIVEIDWVKLKRVLDETEDVDPDTAFLKLDVQDTFNLMELVNGEKTILGILDSIPVGEYSEIRMHVVESRIVLKNGKDFHLKIPSGQSSGLKIKIKPSLLVEEGSDSEILLDFDASRSFKVIGGMHNKGKGKGKYKEIKGFMFKPVIRASNLTETGSLSGTVTEIENGSAIKNAHLYLVKGSEPDLDTVAGARTTPDGFYKIIGIPEGDYNLVCDKEGYEKAEAVVSINVGAETSQDFELIKLEEE